MPLESSGDELRDLALPADERARGQGQVRRVERPQRREVAVAELVQTLGVDEILEPVLSQIADPSVALEKPPGRLGEDDLASVGRRSDPGGAVDVHPDVPLVGLDRLSRVEPHADADRSARERLSPVLGRRDCVRRSREGDEERVALGIHLRAVVPREGVPQGAAVLGEEIGVVRPVLLQEPRRALDVGEEKRDGAGGKLGPGHDRDQGSLDPAQMLIALSVA